MVSKTVPEDVLKRIAKPLLESGYPENKDRLVTGTAEAYIRTFVV